MQQLLQEQLNLMWIYGKCYRQIRNEISIEYYKETVTVQVSFIMEETR